MPYLRVSWTGFWRPPPFLGDPPMLGYFNLHVWCITLSVAKWSVVAFLAPEPLDTDDFDSLLLWLFPCFGLLSLSKSLRRSMSMQCWPTATCWLVTLSTFSESWLYMMSKRMDYEPTLWYVVERESTVDMPSSSNVIAFGVSRSLVCTF